MSIDSLDVRGVSTESLLQFRPLAQLPNLLHLHTDEHDVDQDFAFWIFLVPSLKVRCFMLEWWFHHVFTVLERASGDAVANSRRT